MRPPPGDITAIWTSSKMLVWGGDDSGVPMGNGAAYDPVANMWTALSSNSAPVARFDHAAVWTGQEMLIVGGTTGVTELALPARPTIRPRASGGN